MIRLIRAEFLKLRTTQVWFWLLLATIAVAVAVTLGQTLASGGIKYQADVPDLFSGFARTPAYALVFVLGVLGVTTEFRYQTITPTLLQTPSRWALITAKMITYAILGAVYAVIAVVVEGAIGIPVLKSKKNLTVHLGDSSVQHAIFGTFGVIALFGIIGLGVGALLKNQIVAVVIGILFLVVVENILVVIPGVKKVWPYLPDGGVAAILRTGSDEGTVNHVHVLSTGAGVLVLALWAFVPAIIGAAFTLNRDIT